MAILGKAVEGVLGSSLSLCLTIIDHSPTPLVRAELPRDPRLVYIHNPLNPGFGAGHNLAMLEAVQSSHYHLVLNPDVEFDPAILQRMFQHMEENPSVGMISPKILYPSGEVQHLCKLLPTPADVFLRRVLGNTDWVKRRNMQYEMRKSGYDQKMNVPCLSGCFMMIRSSVLKEVGVFDERFFMYFEDVDLGRRIHQHYVTLFFPGCIVIHHYQKGSYFQINLLRTHIRSAIAYFGKWGWVFDAERDSINATAKKITRIG